VRSVEPALIASYFTLAGDIKPLEGIVVSPWSFRERAEAAGRAGFSGFGFELCDLEHILQSATTAEVRTILAANGLHLVEIEVLLDWFCDGDRRIASDSARRRMLRLAEELGASHIKVGSDISGGAWPLDRVTEEFARLCDEAASAGTRVGIELLPVASLATIEDGMTVVSGAGRENGGLVIDIWHMTRGNIDFAQIAALPRSVITHVELDDGPAVPERSFFEETICCRELCGEGHFDIQGFLRAIRATGYDGTFGIELLSDAHRMRSVDEAASRACDTTRECLRRWFLA
jgi:sugar phosphate isomerase/epimerase